jgi:cytidine kinase
MSLLVVGSVALDSIETPSDSRHRILGGSATYFSYAASFFAPVRLVGIVGKDWPDRYSQLLSQRGIDLSGLECDAERNSYFWHGRYSDDLQDRETIACEVQGFDRFVPKLPTHFKDSRFVFLGAASPSVQLETLEQCTNAEWTFADTVDMWIERSPDDFQQVLKRLDGLFINDLEARQFTGQRDLIRAGRQLQMLGPRMVIIKKGEHGCLFFHDNDVAAVPAFPTDQIVDPTGAGDSFAGGILGYLSNQPAMDLPTLISAVHYGTVVASYTVGGFSLDGLERIQMADIQERWRAFRSMLFGEL